ncbi:MAG: MBL fold metallo-hydrolase [Bdellovibrionales bacterium]
MRVKLWGVRGSLPSPGLPDSFRFRLEDVLTQFERLKEAGVSISARAFVETLPPHLIGGYGGNTSCAEVNHGGARLLIDAGSGIRGFSDHIMRTVPATQEFHIYLTHFHWDHLIGLPFFVPMYIKGKTVHFYSVQEEMEEALRTLFRKPFFPVPYESIQSQVKVHRVAPRKPFRVGEINVTPYELDHPDPCWGIRVEAGGKILAWSVDTECTRSSREEMAEDAKLYYGADLMVFDAQYTFGEALEKINWGHSSGPTGIDVAIREEVKQAVFVHHDPGATDEMIRRAEEQTQQYYEEILRMRKKSGMSAPDLRWHFAREGEEFQL